MDAVKRWLMALVALVAGMGRGAAQGARESVQAQSSAPEPVPESRKEAEDEEPSGRNVAEWVTLLVSFFVVALMVGVAFYEHFVREEPPGTWISVEMDLDRAVRREDQFYVPFTVRNAGSDPAEDVVVIFAVKEGETVVEESTTTITFLANSGSADGHLATEYDPATHTIEARAATLLTP